MKRYLKYTFVCILMMFASAYASDTDKKESEPDGVFLSLDLHSASSIGIANSFELREIKAKETLYDLSIYESLREFFPSLSFSYLQTEETRRRESDDRQTRMTVESELDLYDGGRKNLNYDIAKLNALLARNDYRISLNSLISVIREQYLNLLKLRETVEIHRKTLEHGDMQLTFIRKEFELGDATKLGVMEVEAKVKEIELNLKGAMDEYETSVKKFKLLLKVNWQTPVVIKGDLDRDFTMVPVSGINDDELINIAVRMRKEIESSEAKYEIAVKNNSINENYYLPKVSVGFNYNLTGEDFPPREKGWGVNMKISSKLFGNTFNGGTGYNENGNSNSRARSQNAEVNVLDDMPYRRSLVESRIEMARGMDEKTVTRETISVDVSASCSSLRSAWDMIEIAGKRLELYDSQLEIERLKANMGESRRYDLVEKEIDRGEAAVALLNSKIKYLLAASSLELAVGMDAGFLRNYVKEKDRRRE